MNTLNLCQAWLLLCTCVVFVAGDAGIPVLVFSSDDGLKQNLHRPLAGHTVSTEEFSDFLSNLPRSDLLVTFIQDELSNEDFLRLGNDMKRGGLFKNTQKYSEKKSSVFYPSVKAPVHSLRDLIAHYDEKIELKEADQVVPYLTKTKLQKDTSIVIDLHLTADEQFSTKAINANDRIIGDVMRVLEEAGLTYTAFFTGKHHRRSHAAVVMQGVNRHLLQTSPGLDNSTLIFYNTSDCMVFLQDVNMGGEHNLLNRDIDVSCTNTTSAMDVVLATKASYDAATGNGTLGEELVRWVFAKDDETSMWFLNATILKGKVPNNLPDVSAPVKFSYHCNELTQFTFQNATPVTIGRIQIQVFEFDTADVFGYAYDCTGFFTIPLWTGLLTALFLIAVTMYGLMMLSSVQTFDLYDDPKSKPLVINVSE